MLWPADAVSADLACVIVLIQLHGGSPDTAIQKWIARVDIPPRSGVVCSHRVYRTISSESHTIVLSTSSISLEDELSRPATGVVLSHQTWTILTEIEDKSAPQQHSTLIRAFSSLSFSSAQAGWEKAFVKKTMLPKWREALTSGRQRLENELIDRQRVLVRAEAA